MLTYAIWGLGRKMFTKLGFQSRSKKFWNRWLLKQYAIIVRGRLINIPYLDSLSFLNFFWGSIWIGADDAYIVGEIYTL